MSGQTVEAGPAGEAETTNSGHDRGASAGQRQQVRTDLYPRRARPDASLPDRGTSPTVLLRVRELSGCLKNDAAPDLNGMVGETFVEPTQQGDIESGGDPMRPFLIMSTSNSCRWRSSIASSSRLICAARPGSRDSTTSFALLPSSTVGAFVGCASCASRATWISVHSPDIDI
jgi:hypothetical protein